VGGTRSFTPPRAAAPRPAAAPATIRVLHILEYFGTAGMERGVRKIICGAAPGFEHSLIIQRTTGDQAPLLPPQVSVTALNRPERNSIRHLLRMVRQIRRLRPHIVHTRNWAGMDGIVAATLARVPRIIHGEHGWNMEDPQGLDRKRRIIRRLLSRRVDEFTCVSQHIATWLREEVRVRGPITQIYNGVDTDRYAPGTDGLSVREELGIPADAFVVGFVGRLDAIKGLPVLAGAFARLRVEHPEAHLVIVGEGPEAHRLRERAGAGLHMAGLRRDVPSFLRTFDVFSLASDNEGISNAILEAMAVGLPVAATRVGGNPELVLDGETGRLFERGDEEGLYRILREYLRHPELRRRHAAAARARAVESFSLQAMVRGYEAVYSRVAAPTLQG